MTVFVEPPPDSIGGNALGFEDEEVPRFSMAVVGIAADCKRTENRNERRMRDLKAPNYDPGVG